MLYYWVDNYENYASSFVEETIEGEHLNLTRVTRNHMGAYLCIAYNGVPPPVSKRIVLKVHCKYLCIIYPYSLVAWSWENINPTEYVVDFSQNSNMRIRHSRNSLSTIYTSLRYYSRPRPAGCCWEQSGYANVEMDSTRISLDILFIHPTAIVP